jgi:vacuolar-type H+-ATPase subunit I/STV1
MSQRAVTTASGAAPQPAQHFDNTPLTFRLDLSSEKAQTNFIIDQQQLQINDLKQQLAVMQMEREAK